MEDRVMSSREETKAPTETQSEDWALLPWRKLELCVPTAKENLSSLRTWQRPGSPQTATVVDAVTVS